MRLPQMAVDHVAQGPFEAGREDIGPAVVVVVEEPARKSLVRLVNAHLLGNIGECTVAIVAIEAGRAGHVGNVQVRIAVAVEVAPVGPLAPERAVVDAGSARDILKRAVAAIMVKAARSRFAADENVQPTVVVVIRPDRHLSIDRRQQAGFFGDIGECAVAVVTKQAVLLRDARPGAPANIDIQQAVVVVIGLDAVEPTDLLGEASRLGSFLKRAIAPVAIKRQRLSRVHARHDQVEQAIVVEIVHNRPARQVQLIQTEDRCDVGKSPDIGLRFKRSEREPILGRHFLGILAERHVGQVQQPARPGVVREILQILGEVANRLPRSFALLVDRRGEDRKDAARLALAFHAVFVLAEAECGHALQEDQRRKLFLQARLLLDVVPDLSEDLARLHRLALVQVKKSNVHQCVEPLVESEIALRQAFLNLLNAAITGMVIALGDVLQ